MNFAPSPKSASVIAREARQNKGRNRHLPHQTDALNEVFERTEHPSLEERTDLAKRLGMWVVLFLPIPLCVRYSPSPIAFQGNQGRQLVVPEQTSLREEKESAD
jgi:hypothetical protein